MIILLKYRFILLSNQKISYFLSGNTGLEPDPKLWTKVEPKRSQSRKKIISAPRNCKIKSDGHRRSIFRSDIAVIMYLQYRIANLYSHTHTNKVIILNMKQFVWTLTTIFENLWIEKQKS